MTDISSAAKAGGGRTLAGALLIAFVLGSLHAYSVLIEPMEAKYEASRSSVALVYSLATMALICGVYASSRVFGWLGPPGAALFAGLGCAAGLVLAAAGGSLVAVFVGFAGLFGFANGIGYALSIERAGVAFPGRRGVCLGLVTAAYCGGAIVFSKVFALWPTPQGFGTGLLVLATVVAAAGLAVAGLLRTGPRVAGQAADAGPAGLVEYRGEIRRLWLIYFLGVLAGMMALGHAAAIVSANGGSLAEMTTGAMLISVGSACGSIVCGWVADRMAPRLVLTLCLAAVAGAMMLLLVSVAPASTVMALGLAGVAYGALITIIPVIVTGSFPAEVSYLIFGRVFTAWGVAGLAGPWLGGLVFDATSSYGAAFAIAAAAALAAGLVSLLRHPQAAG